MVFVSQEQYEVPAAMPVAQLDGWLPHAAYAASSAVQSTALSLPVTPDAEQPPAESLTWHDIYMFCCVKGLKTGRKSG